METTTKLIKSRPPVVKRAYLVSEGLHQVRWTPHVYVGSEIRGEHLVHLFECGETGVWRVWGSESAEEEVN